MLVALLGRAVSSLQGRPRVTWNNAHRAGIGRTATLLPGSTPVRGVAGNLGAQRPHEVAPVSVRCNREDETGWDLGPFAAVLAPGQMSPRATKYKDTIKGLKQNKTKLHTRGFSRVTAGFSSYDGEFRMPLVLAQASPIFHSSCEGKLGIALE